MVMFEILEYTPSRVVNISVGDSIFGVFLQEISEPYAAHHTAPSHQIVGSLLTN